MTATPIRWTQAPAHFFALILLSLSAFFALSSCNALPTGDSSHSPQQTPSKTSPQHTEDPDEDILKGATRSTELESAINAPLSNTSEIKAALSLASMYAANFRGQGIKIAILDNGFAGLDQSKGKQLPATLQLDAGTGNSAQETPHGTKMAEIAWALATGAPAWTKVSQGPELLLLNANGFSNFEHAVDAAVKAGANIILYSQVWEYGGNGDGHGFINKVVKRATDAGILWLNAAGNNGKSTWSGSLIRKGEKVVLPYGGESLRLRVSQAATPVKIVLAWNDFQDTPEYRTNQDLDLVVEDCRGKEITSSRLIQDGSSAENQEGHSAHAREYVRATLEPGVYCLKVLAKSASFPATTRLRVSVDGSEVELIDRNVDHQLLIPADNPDVIVVGASDVDYSATQGVPDDTLSRGQGTPDLSVPSKVKFGQDIEIRGTSAATAIAAGALASWMSATGLRPDATQVRAMLASGRLANRQGSWSASLWCHGQQQGAETSCEGENAPIGYVWAPPALFLSSSW